MFGKCPGTPATRATGSRLWRPGNRCFAAVWSLGDGFGGPVEFTISAANPLDYADEIKQLFATHGRPEFPAFFDRAYGAAVRAGGQSWLARDGAGTLVMHVACFPRRFRFGARDIVGGLLMNAMATAAYRSFFPARTLMRHARDGAGAAGRIDFLYTDPNEPARAVLEGAGFRRIGTLARHVLLVGDRRWMVDGVIRLLRAARAGLRAAGARPATIGVAAGASADGFDAPWGDSPRLRPHYDAGVYAARLEGYPGSLDRWFTVSENGAASPLAAGALIRGPDASGIATLYALRRRPELSLGIAMRGLVGALREHRCTRLQLLTLVESQFSAELRRVGFAIRPEATPFLATALTPIGETALEAVRDWEITGLDCDR